MIVLLLLVLATTILLFYLKNVYSYWEKRGLKGPKPTLLIGNMGKSCIFKELPGTVYYNIYKQFPDEEIIGIYRQITPALMAKSPDAIKEITTKSFNHFHDNDLYVDIKQDPIFGKNPLMLKGDEWKIVRSHLTPGFTSGKMKWIYPLLEETSSQLIKYIDPLKCYEAKDLALRFTLNNVASCAFGLEGNCFQEQDSEFKKLANEVFSVGSWTTLALTLSFGFPDIAKYLPVGIVSKSAQKKLFRIVSETLKYRSENNIVRNDFLHILSQLQQTAKDYKFTDLDVTAHASGFFGDGAETASIVMSFAMFDLAQNPETQTRLRQEINNAYEANNGTFPYEVLQSLDYLEACIYETLRLHPPIFHLQKLCTKDFVYETKNGQSVKIDRGTPVVIPIAAIHWDPEFYPEPMQYNPERFLEENKDQLTKYTFLAFGEGPRQCLGRRFGLLQVKAGIANIIQNFELSVNKKTKVPLKYLSSYALTTPEGGLWIDFKKTAQ